MWGEVLAAVVDGAHLVTGDRLSVLVDDAVRPTGLTVEIYLVDLAQASLRTARPGRDERIDVEGTVAGRVHQLGEIVAGTDDHAERVLWCPILDGTERVGVLRLGLGAGLVDDDAFRRGAWTLAGLLGLLLISKTVYSDHLRVLRSGRALSPESELLWQLVPPRTFATPHVVVSALLEPYDRVAGDAYDYVVDGDTVELALFDGVGHDLGAGVATALAVTAIRASRRRERGDLARTAARADEALLALDGTRRFVTAVLARLDTRTGALDYVVAGHPPPLLIRDGHIVKELDAHVQRPLGVPAGTRPASAREHLQPGDRLLLYTDGIIEARDDDGRFFGTRRLVDLTERAELAQVSAPETLRRLVGAVLEHQNGRLQDDASLLLLEWSSEAHRRLLPAVRDSAPDAVAGRPGPGPRAGGSLRT